MSHSPFETQANSCVDEDKGQIMTITCSALTLLQDFHISGNESSTLSVNLELFLGGGGGGSFLFALVKPFFLNQVFEPIYLSWVMTCPDTNPFQPQGMRAEVINKTVISLSPTCDFKKNQDKFYKKYFHMPHEI